EARAGHGTRRRALYAAIDRSDQPVRCRDRRAAREGVQMKRIAVLLNIVIALVLSSSAFAHEGEKIGTVKFPVSCMPAVQQPFERAVAVLHSFWYLEAAKAFTQITQTDPGCAMAYWGLALTNWPQIWSPP